MIALEEKKELFRDSVATISKEGKRNFINPKKPKGKLYTLRTWFSICYLVIFFGLPFIKVNDAPLMLFNVLERKFILFGMIFWPQDFFIFGIGMLTFIVFVILFTVIFGRVFCGWACPQTIFMEMVFRKIEYWIDGDAMKQKQLKKMPWNATKTWKRTLKFTVFFIVSFIIANFFLAYLVGMDQLISGISDPAANLSTLISLIGFTIVFFLVYWWFREQACIVVCPYGRLQGVLLDKNSIVVAYDHKRGEQRGKLLKNSAGVITPLDGQGDCVDCFACVKVCPTGIDIRNGTQLECINCTACIDACNSIMTNINKPLGLVRYASENSINSGTKLRITRRIKAYSAVLCLLIGLLVFLILSRTDLDARLMRTAGMTYTSLPDGRVSNLYNLKLSNKTHKPIPVTLKLENIPGEISLIEQQQPVIKQEDHTTIQFFVKLNRKDLTGWKTNLRIGLYDPEKKIRTIEAKFIGPEVYD